MPDTRLNGSTTAQLKADIDSGRTGDKVAGSDPAASPLGTDDEAAGTPPTPGRIAMARANETQKGVADKPHRQGSMVGILVAVIVVIAVVAWFAVRR